MQHFFFDVVPFTLIERKINREKANIAYNKAIDDHA
jgi:hypothetical protein